MPVFSLCRSFITVSMLLAAALLHAEEIRQVRDTAGVMVPYLLSADFPEGGAPVVAVAILFSGDDGYQGLLERGIPSPGANFLVRSRKMFVGHGIAVAVIDSPVDMHGMSDRFRMSPRHVGGVAAVAGDLAAQFPGAQVFLVGTSRGTISAAYVGAALGEGLGGVVLTSAVFNASRGGTGLAGFDYTSIKAPLLFVHHVDDTCGVTPYWAAEALAKNFPLISVRGGDSARSGPCEPFSPHGFLGRERAVVDAIVDWMLKRPYPGEID